MKRLKSLFRQTEFHVLFFCISLAVFGWPVVTFSDVDRLSRLFIYLFVAWAAVILVLFLVSRSIAEAETQDESEARRE